MKAVLAVIVVCSVLALAPGAAAAADACEPANNLVKAGLLDEASILFIKLAKAGNECSDLKGQSGVERVELQRGQAQGLLDKAQIEADTDANAAIADLSSALGLNRGLTGASDQLATLLGGPSSSTSPYAGAQQLAKLGFNDDGKTEAVKVATGHPDAAFPDDLRYLMTDPQWPGRDFARLLAGPVAAFTGVVPILIVTFGFVYLVWGRSWQFMRSRRLAISDPVGADGQVPVIVKSVITSELTLLSQDGAGTKLNFMSSPDSPLEVPTTVTDALPELKILTALISLFKATPWTLSTTILFDPTQGTGLRLVLSDPLNRPYAVGEVWEHDFNASEDFLPSVPPSDTSAAHTLVARAAAAWVAYAFRASDDQREALRVAAASAWQSYALFRIGAEAQDASPGRAAEYYRRALSLDPHNPGACFNAGTLRLAGLGLPGDAATELRTLASNSFKEAVEATKRMAEAGLGGATVNPLWYRAKYNLAVVAYEQVLAKSTDTRHKADWCDAIEQARDVTKQAAEVALKATARFGRWKPANLQDLIPIIEEAGGLMLAGAVIEYGRTNK